MSIWHKEVVRVKGDLMAYVEIQNDWTGDIRGGLRELHIDGDRYYVRADGNRVDVTDDRQKMLDYEDKVKRALKIMRDNNFM